MSKPSSRLNPKLLWLATLSLLLSACSGLGAMLCGSGCTTRHTHADGSSSLVEFLYPKGGEPPARNSIPELVLPLRVGLAFLPPRSGSSALAPDAAQREQLLEQIASRFKERSFIKSLTVIPDRYLQAGGQNLESLQRLYQIDALALVSYDQVGYQSDLRRSWTYLTIVGAFLMNGTRNESNTLMDLAVIEPRTRALLLRAGGTDSRSQDTNLVDSERDARTQSDAGYAAATTRLIDNFELSLKQFELDVRAERAPAKVRWGSGGGGSMNALWLGALLGLALVRRRAGAFAPRAAPPYNGALLFGTSCHANSRRSTHFR